MDSDSSGSFGVVQEQPLTSTPQITTSQITTVGIDVGGARKGFHAVALCGGAYHSRFTSSDAAALPQWCVATIGAQVVAIDAPSRQRAIEHPANDFCWMLRREALYKNLEPSH